MNFENVFDAAIAGLVDAGYTVDLHPWEREAVLYAPEEKDACGSVLQTDDEVAVCWITGVSQSFYTTQGLEWVNNTILGYGKCYLQGKTKPKRGTVQATPPRGCVELIRSWAKLKGWSGIEIPTPPDGWVSKGGERIRIFPRRNGRWAYYRDLDEEYGEALIRRWPNPPTGGDGLWPSDNRKAKRSTLGLPATLYNSISGMAQALESVWLLPISDSLGGWGIVGGYGLFISKVVCGMKMSSPTPEWCDGRNVPESRAREFLEDVAYPSVTLNWDMGLLPKTGTVTFKDNQWSSSEDGGGQLEADLSAPAVKVSVHIFRQCAKATGSRGVVSIGVGRVGTNDALVLDGPKGTAFFLPLKG